MRVPILETERLTVRPFVMGDLERVHDLLDVRLGRVDVGSEGAMSRDERERWLRWTVLNYEALARLKQPPYGDRAVVLRPSGRLIGACGYVSCLGPFGQLASAGRGPAPRLHSTEFGLYYAIAPEEQGRGYATEAAAALVNFAFRGLGLARVVATTGYENAASARVMAKIGMRVERNPHPDPPWFQIVGIIDNPAPAPMSGARSADVPSPVTPEGC